MTCTIHVLSTQMPIKPSKRRVYCSSIFHVATQTILAPLPGALRGIMILPPEHPIPVTLVVRRCTALPCPHVPVAACTCSECPETAANTLISSWCSCIFARISASPSSTSRSTQRTGSSPYLGGTASLGTCTIGSPRLVGTLVFGTIVRERHWLQSEMSVFPLGQFRLIFSGGINRHSRRTSLSFRRRS